MTNTFNYKIVYFKKGALPPKQDLSLAKSKLRSETPLR